MQVNERVLWSGCAVGVKGRGRRRGSGVGVAWIPGLGQASVVALVDDRGRGPGSLESALPTRGVSMVDRCRFGSCCVPLGAAARGVVLLMQLCTPLARFCRRLRAVRRLLIGVPSGLMAVATIKGVWPWLSRDRIRPKDRPPSCLTLSSPPPSSPACSFSSPWGPFRSFHSTFVAVVRAVEPQGSRLPHNSPLFLSLHTS